MWRDAGHSAFRTSILHHTPDDFRIEAVDRDRPALFISRKIVPEPRFAAVIHDCKPAATHAGIGIVADPCRRIAALEATDPLLADYLSNTRTWSEPHVECPSAIEHEGWTLPRIIYSQRDSGVATYPKSPGSRSRCYRISCWIDWVVSPMSSLHAAPKAVPPGGYDYRGPPSLNERRNASAL